MLKLCSELATLADYVRRIARSPQIVALCDAADRAVAKIDEYEAEITEIKAKLAELEAKVQHYSHPVRFDKTAYQREYMRRRRAKLRSGRSNDSMH